MTRVRAFLFLSLCCTTAWAQYPIYPAFPQPPALAAYAPYSSFYQSLYPGLSAYGYQPFGFGAIPYGGINLLPPNLPSPYYVTPSGREYLEQVRRNEQATYTQLRLSRELQK